MSVPRTGMQVLHVSEDTEDHYPRVLIKDEDFYRLLVFVYDDEQVEMFTGRSFTLCTECRTAESGWCDVFLHDGPPVPVMLEWTDHLDLRAPCRGLEEANEMARRAARDPEAFLTELVL